MSTANIRWKCFLHLFIFIAASSSILQEAGRLQSNPTLQGSVDKCGEANSANSRDLGGSSTNQLSESSRIWGGIEVYPPRKYPWQVALKKTKLDGSIIYDCGGSIINNRWILTSARCIVDTKYTCQPWPWTAVLQVRVGEHNIDNDTDDDPNITYDRNVSRYVIHPDFECTRFSNDFALLELTREIPFNNVIRPVCLPQDDSNNYAGVNGTVTGWGTNKLQTGNLLEVQVPIVTQSNCTDDPSKTDERMLCTGPVLPAKAPCALDVGGPLVVIENNKYVQVGVVSWGSCYSNSSALYSRVSKVLAWIKETTDSGEC